MDEKSFRDEVYKKYEYYKNIKNDPFFNRHQYRKNYSSINKIVLFMIICLFTTGVVYATSYYMKKNNSVWKEPQEYIYEEEKKISEKDITSSISEEEAKNIGLETINKLNIYFDNIVNCYLNKEPSINKIEWVLETDNNLEIRINAKNGELYKFLNKNLLSYNSNLYFDEETAIDISQKIYTNLSYERNYEFAYISNLGNGKWQSDYCLKYNEIFNPYQCVRITFIAETEELVMLNIFDYDFENNSFLITENQAIDYVKNIYGEDKIESISAKKDIQKMNSLIYQKDNPSSTLEYRTDNIVRNIWNVEIIENQHHFKEYYYVDATTGEVIGGNQKK